MKTISHILGSIIIVLAFIVIVLPEIAYSLALRGRDKVIDTIREL